MLIRRLTWITLPSALALACGGNAFTTMEGTGGTSGSGASTGSGGDGSGAAGSGGNGSGAAGSGGDGSGGSGSGGTFSFDRECFSTFECELANNTCCGTCEPPTLDNVMAVAVGQTSEIADALCTDDADCPDCEQIRNPNLFAACVEGTCEALDLTTHEDASCEVDDDCVIIPAACCPCEAEMGPGAIVAANQDAATFKEAQCETTPICGCDPDFVFMPPPGLVATCEAGFCVLPPPPDAP